MSAYVIDANVFSSDAPGAYGGAPVRHLPGWGDVLNMNRPEHQRSAVAGAVLAALLVWAPHADALTLGRAMVRSPIGETMRVEVDFESLSNEEAESLRATIANPEVYRDAGFEYSPALTGARVVLQRLANARPTLRITSDRAVQEPFVELVLEVTWRGGRLVRSYTLLFDLPSTRTVATPPALSGPATAGGSGLVPRITTNPDAAELSTPAGRTPRSAPGARRSIPTSDTPAQVADPFRVRPGDSLSEVAQRGPRPAGVSLDRLILAMYRANPDAFVGGNLHRLRHGVVLNAPSASEMAATTDAEARQVIRAQSADFNGYRRQLAGMPTEQADGPTRRASGKLQAAVEDRKQAAAPTPDKLTLSKPSIASAPDNSAQASKERERRDAATRVAELSKNVQDLGRLSGSVASVPAARASAAAPAAPPPAPTPAPGITLPIERIASAPPLPTASLPAATPSASAAAPTASVPASAPVAARPPAASAAASRPAPRPPVPEPAEPSLMDTLLDDNLPAVGLGGALIALLAVYGLFRLLKRRRAAAPETSFLESRLKPDSFFGASGGQRIDTREVAATGASSSMMNYSLSQLDAIGDVDPVAEADVYLAYGRDLQAEEILKEAMRTTPERMAIRTKLLEVYAKRRDVKGFEQLALQLFDLTGGSGEDWDKAREMGHQLDPENPLYGGEGPRAAPVADARPAYDDLRGNSTLPQADPRDDRATEPPLSSSFDLDLDLDLGMEEAAALSTMPIDTDATVMRPRQPDRPPAPAAAAYAPPAEDMLAFTAPSGFGPLTPMQPPPAPVPPPPVAAPVPTPPPSPPTTPPFNASAFSLDLDLPPPNDLSPGPSMLPPIEGFDANGRAPAPDFGPDSEIDQGDPLVRKLELADEFRQIGDVEGARDLLQEVVDRAEGSLKVKAEAMLASLS